MAFKKIPLEINELIASFLTDLMQNSICRQANRGLHLNKSIKPATEFFAETIPALFTVIYQSENASFMSCGTCLLISGIHHQLTIYSAGPDL